MASGLEKCFQARMRTRRPSVPLLCMQQWSSLAWSTAPGHGRCTSDLPRKHEWGAQTGHTETSIPEKERKRGLKVALTSGQRLQGPAVDEMPSIGQVLLSSPPPSPAQNGYFMSSSLVSLAYHWSSLYRPRGGSREQQRLKSSVGLP